jgi:hypothetical protein
MVIIGKTPEKAVCSPTAAKMSQNPQIFVHFAENP